MGLGKGRSQAATQAQQQPEPTSGELCKWNGPLENPQDLLRPVIGYRAPPQLRQSLKGVTAEGLLLTALLAAGVKHPSEREWGDVSPCPP